MGLVYRSVGILTGAILFGMFSVILVTLLDGEPARFAYALRGFIPAFLMSAFFRLNLKSPRVKDLAWATILGVLTIMVLMIGLELRRLAIVAPEFAWNERLTYFDRYTLGGAMIVPFLALLSTRVAFQGTGLNRAGRKAPKRSTKAVFGDADFMSMREAANLFPEGPGVVIGERYRPDLDLPAGPVFDPRLKPTWGKGGKAPLLCYDATFGSTHGLVFAGSGGFKTTGIVIPTALNWTGSIVCLDPSCEVEPMVRNHRMDDLGTADRIVHRLDPKFAYGGFNVLDWIADSDAPDENISAVANWLISDKLQNASGSDDFFRTSAVQLLTGLLADIVFGPYYKPEDRNLSTLRATLAASEPKLRARLKDIHNAYDDETDQGRFVRQNVAPFIAMTDTTFSGIYASASKDTQWLSFKRYAKLVCGNDFETRDILSGKVDVFINIPLKALNDHPGLGRVIIGSFLNAMYEADGRAERPVLFMLDEAATLGRLRIIETARETQAASTRSRSCSSTSRSASSKTPGAAGRRSPNGSSRPPTEFSVP